jgi:hypothetical protein
MNKTFWELDQLPSSGEGQERVFCWVHYVELTSLIGSTCVPEIRICHLEITGKCKIKTAEAYRYNSVLEFVSSFHIFVTA